jgi:hypothetical protein
MGRSSHGKKGGIFECGGIIGVVENRHVMEYESPSVETLSEAERRGFVLLLPAAIGVVVGGVCWVIVFLVTRS